MVSRSLIFPESSGSIPRRCASTTGRDELDLGSTKANAQVAGFLFSAAKSGNVTAQIFWLKTRARWKETPSEHRHSGAIGTFDLTQLADEALEQIIRSAGGTEALRAVRKPPVIEANAEKSED
jgi:hypothetical protein